MTELDNLHKVLIQELNASCDMVKLAIENMDSKIWSNKTNEWSYVQTLYHIIDTLEFYSNDEPKKLIKEGGLGVYLPTSTKEEVNKVIDEKPKDFFFDYLEKVRNFAIEKINSFTTDELFSTDKFAEWGFTSRFHKLSYTFRHTMMHTGELNKTLRDLKKKRLQWL